MIFEQLQSPEIFKISEVCKSWFSIAQHPAVVKKTIVTLNDVSNEFFLNCNRKFSFNLILVRHNINSCDLPQKYFQFKEKWGQNITEINLVDLYLPSVEMFCNFIKDLKNLRKLKFNDCRFKDSKVYPCLSINTSNLFEFNDIRNSTKF